MYIKQLHAKRLHSTTDKCSVWKCIVDCLGAMESVWYVQEYGPSTVNIALLKTERSRGMCETLQMILQKEINHYPCFDSGHAFLHALKSRAQLTV